jgi:hypothetical protein
MDDKSEWWRTCAVSRWRHGGFSIEIDRQVRVVLRHVDHGRCDSRRRVPWDSRTIAGRILISGLVLAVPVFLGPYHQRCSSCSSCLHTECLSRGAQLSSDHGLPLRNALGICAACLQPYRPRQRPVRRSRVAERGKMDLVTSSESNPSCPTPHKCVSPRRG